MTIYTRLLSALWLILAAAVICFCPIKSICQTNDIDFVIEKIISDYPGYREKTEGFDFRNWAHQIARANSNDTFKALSQIVGFFKDEHLRIRTPKKNLHDDSVHCAVRKSQIISYLKNSKLSPREGFWINDRLNCLVGLRVASKSPEILEAVVVENNNSLFQPGVTLCKMEYLSKNEYYTDFRSPISGARGFIHAVFRNDSVFTTAAESKWRKIKEYNPAYINRLESKTEKPSSRILDSSTYLLTIPISLYSNLSIVDSIVKSDSGKIAAREILIIDLRGNVGGSASVFEPLLPWIYTNAIKRVAARQFITERTIADYKQFIDGFMKLGPLEPDDDSIVAATISNMQGNLGSFREPYLDTITFSQIRKYPKKVGLIIDYGCQSAAELLILTFLQSSKVTTFGEHTRGAVDYLSFYPQETPSKKYTLFIATSKRVFKEGEELDGKGIYPMVPISDDVPDWVEYVKNYLKQNPETNKISSNNQL